MENFKLQNCCLLMGILLLDAVVYLLMAILAEDFGETGAPNEELVHVALYHWHAVNLLLIGSIFFSALRKRRAPRERQLGSSEHQMAKHKGHDR